MESKDRILEEIRLAEEKLPLINRDSFRQGFHLMPPVGWLNDPNGLCQCRGEYNVFFQYSPKNPNGGEKYWGHYKSSDLIRWKYMGVPLVTDTVWDADGVYSGSGLAEGDKLHIFYTGNVKLKDGNYDYITSGRQTNVVYSNDNGYEKKLLIGWNEYPEGYTCHIRDPKVWKENGKYYMVLGARRLDDKGAVLLYESEKPDRGWRFLKEITTAEKFGYMWECPDVFRLGEKTVLSVSPQGVKNEEYRLQNIYQSGYFLSDKSIFEDYMPDGFEEWDYGFDFYAPQTFRDDRGRRILIGWVGMPDADYTNPTAEKGWQNCLSVPRILEYKNGRIYQSPAEELEALRLEEREIKAGERFEAEKADIIITDIEGDFFANIREAADITYKEGIFEIRLKNFGRTSRKLRLDRLNSLRLLCDSSVIEIYINEGEYVMTSMFYTKSRSSLIGSGRIRLYEMKNMEVCYR